MQYAYLLMYIIRLKFCYFFSRGTLGVVDMTIGDACDLHLGSTGNTQGISTVSPTGIFDFNALTVKAGGEVTVTHDLTDETSSMAITVSIGSVRGKRGTYTEIRITNTEVA